jgi:sterol desaturase/sphingolipid hydroxylase (fatty acid hydroxylase superfamily)
MLTAALVATLAALGSGVRGELVLPFILVGAAVLVAAGERLFPYRASWNRTQGDLAADAVYFPMTVIVNALLEPGVKLLAVAGGAWLSSRIGVGLWPATWPLPLQLGWACVIAELFDYFAHRVMHENAWLWRLHATHHSSSRLYWLNATRAHPGEMLFRGTIGILPLALLGAGQDVFILLAVVNIVVGLFQHANIDIALGPLSWVFSVGDLHRWHHSRARDEADSNYGNNFIFWDAVFGTRYLPRERTPPERIGIDGLDGFPEDVVAQILSPFRWQQIVRASAE